MHKHDNKLAKTANTSIMQAIGSKPSFKLEDNRPDSIVQQKQIEALQNRSSKDTVVQQKQNNTGLPDKLKSGIENLSGHTMDDVKVNYNSSQPAQLNAHAYAQGNQIHIAPGQEKHLPHEAWHVVQQKQGRVKPTLQMKNKVNVNDDKRLEDEADRMGAKAINASQNKSTNFTSVLQQQSFIQFTKSKRQRELEKAAKAQKAGERAAEKSEISESYNVTKVKKPKEVKAVEALNLAEARREFRVDARMPHIWNRHAPTSKKPGKSLFPVGWTQSKAANAITQVIVNASKYSESAKYGKSIRGYFDGILIEVYFMPSEEEDEFEVSTAYPVKDQDGIVTNPGEDDGD